MEPPDGGVTRRKFNSVAAAAAAGWILTACGPKRLYDVPKDRLKQAIADSPAIYDYSNMPQVPALP